jgi:signal-transduction protein with cAMP-binding, CBS, and nucleotidyltransferase domain
LVVPSEEASKLEIRDIIRKHEIETIGKDATVAEALNRMIASNLESIIVKRADINDAYGLVTRRDVLYKVVAQGQDPAKVKVTEIMMSPLVILNNIHLDVSHAARTMANTHVSTIVVFDKGDIYGFLSGDDILNAVSKGLIRKALDKQI